MPTAAGGGIGNPKPPSLRHRLPACMRRCVQLGLLLCLCTGAGAGREDAGADRMPRHPVPEPGILRLRGCKDWGAHGAHASKSRRAQQKTRVERGTPKGEMQVRKCALGAR